MTGPKSEGRKEAMAPSFFPMPLAMPRAVNLSWARRLKKRGMLLMDSTPPAAMNSASPAAIR